MLCKERGRGCWRRGEGRAAFLCFSPSDVRPALCLRLAVLSSYLEAPISAHVPGRLRCSGGSRF